MEETGIRENGGKNRGLGKKGVEKMGVRENGEKNAGGSLEHSPPRPPQLTVAVVSGSPVFWGLRVPHPPAGFRNLARCWGL